LFHAGVLQVEQGVVGIIDGPGRPASEAVFFRFSGRSVAGSKLHRNLFFSAMVNPIFSSRLGLDVVCPPG
jgi:hypothetical protein